MGACVSHPDTFVRPTRFKAHITQSIGETFPIPRFTRAEAVKSVDNHHDMSL
jgi:hypothetical protein